MSNIGAPISGNLFNSQESEFLKAESDKFYKAQDEYIVANDIKYNKNQNYICKEFYQYIVETYIDNQHAGIKDLANEWMFGKALDIHIRNCMTDRRFIQENSEMKGNFYSNAMYRLQNFTIRTYDRTQQSVFVYFTSTIHNSFKEELNSNDKQKLIRKNIKLTHGLDCMIDNAELPGSVISNNTISTELENDYELEFDTIDSRDVPLVIQDLSKKYNFMSVSILEDANVPRFKRTYQDYDFCIPVIVPTLGAIELDKDIVSYEFKGKSYKVNTSVKLDNTKSDLEDIFSDNTHNTKICGTLKLMSNGEFTYTPILDIDELTIVCILENNERVPYIIKVTPIKGIVVEYIDLSTMNEREGVSKMQLQKRNLVARRNGYQVLEIYSDDYYNESYDDSIYFETIDLMIKLISEDAKSMTDTTLENRYIHQKWLDECEISEPEWSLIINDKANTFYEFRLVPDSQDISTYIEYKNENSDYTRVYNSGYLTIKGDECL